MKKMVVCALAATFVAQIWGMISWMVLPWHEMDFRQFKNDVNVESVVRSENQGSGLYLVPNMDPEMHGNEEKMKAWDDRASKGPFVFMSVRAEGITPGMGVPMAIGMLVNFFTALVLCWLVGQTSIDCPKGRTVFFAVAGSIGAVFPHISNWNWWNFPIGYCAVGVIDLFITWLLAGFVVAKISDKMTGKTA